MFLIYLLNLIFLSIFIGHVQSGYIYVSLNRRKPSLDKEQPEVSFYEQNLFPFIHCISHGNPTEGLIRHTFFVSPVNFFSTKILVGGTSGVRIRINTNHDRTTGKKIQQILQRQHWEKIGKSRECYNLAGGFILAIIMKGLLLLKNLVFCGVYISGNATRRLCRTKY